MAKTDEERDAASGSIACTMSAVASHTATLSASGTLATTASAVSSGTAKLQSRYSFTAQFVGGAVLLARRARAIEAQPRVSEQDQAEHRALVVAAIMQAAGAIEAEVAEIMQHGPGHFLGSNGTDHAAHALLSPLAKIIDRQQGPLGKYETVLELLRKPALDKGSQQRQDAALLVELRNELVHYKSYLGGVTKVAGLLIRLQDKHFAAPPFVPPATNPFPDKVLGFQCANWACETAAAFLDHVCDLLGTPSVLDGHRLPGATFEGIIPPRRG